MEAVLRARVILDAYPVISYFLDEAAAGEIEDLVSERPTAMSAVTVAEVADVLVRSHGFAAEEIGGVLASLLDETVEVDAASVGVATAAGLLRASWYRRRDRAVSLADCFVIATARPGDAIATADPALAEVARGEGLDVIALPGSDGRRP